MVYGRYNELVFMGFINPQTSLGGHHPVSTYPFIPLPVHPRPAVSITRCACPAGMHCVISSATSGSAMKIAWAWTKRASPVSAWGPGAKKTRNGHFGQGIWRRFPEEITCQLMLLLGFWWQKLHQMSPDWPRCHSQILWRDAISFRATKFDLPQQDLRYISRMVNSFDRIW